MCISVTHCKSKTMKAIKKANTDLDSSRKIALHRLLTSHELKSRLIITYAG